MKIAHIGLSSYFTESMKYQDNLLSHQNALDGNEVMYISNAYKYVDGKVQYTGYEKKYLEDGVCLIRLPYKHVGTKSISGKIRRVDGLYELLGSFSPDIIFVHSLSFASLSDVVKYKRMHHRIKLYADTHAAAYNSGLNYFSLMILHRLIYRKWIQNALPFIDKIFYVGINEKNFAMENYGIPEEMMEFLPLGGTPLEIDEYKDVRNKRREELGLLPNDRLYIHSGKLYSGKRTAELISAFSSVQDSNAKLVIIGSIPVEQMKTIEPLINADKRVLFLGWKSGDELNEYLCACDMYCQPGSVSATLQNAICNYCAVMAYPFISYKNDLNWGNFFWVKSKDDMVSVFESIKNNPSQLRDMSRNSQRCAHEMLDYRIIAGRMYR